MGGANCLPRTGALTELPPPDDPDGTLDRRLGQAPSAGLPPSFASAPPPRPPSSASAPAPPSPARPPSPPAWWASHRLLHLPLDPLLLGGGLGGGAFGRRPPSALRLPPCACRRRRRQTQRQSEPPEPQPPPSRSSRALGRRPPGRVGAVAGPGASSCSAPSGGTSAARRFATGGVTPPGAGQSSGCRRHSGQWAARARPRPRRGRVRARWRPRGRSSRPWWPRRQPRQALARGARSGT